MKTENTDFPIELVIDVEHRHPLSKQARDELYALAEKELRKLAKGHSGITGVNISITAPAEKQNIPFYEATVAVSFRPKNVADPMEALRLALHGVERQVRKEREKLHGH